MKSLNKELSESVHESVYCKDKLDYTMLGINKKIDYVISYVSVLSPTIKNTFYTRYKESEPLLIIIFARMDNEYLECIDKIDAYTAHLIEELNDMINEYNDSYNMKLKPSLLHKIEKLMFESSKSISEIFIKHKSHIIEELLGSINIAVNDYLREGHPLTEIDKEVISILKDGLNDESVTYG